MDADVIVVGAGLAGLTCARHLEKAGLSVHVLEAGDQVGGRVRTDQVDGYLCDRGFQVLNPAYPAVGLELDLPALRMRMFGRGLGVRRSNRIVTLPRPSTLSDLLDLLRTPYANPKGLLDLGTLLRWLSPALGRVPAVLDAPDAGIRDSLDQAHIGGALRREVLEPFLAGVLLERDGTTSANFARLLLRMFVRGTPGLPEEGMGAVPAQLASTLREPIRTGVTVRAVTLRRPGLQVDTLTDSRRARAVVIATDGRTAAGLLGQHAEPGKGVVTWWFAGDVDPAADRYLVVDGRRRRRGPLVNAAVISATQPSYAPAGRQLVQASALLGEAGTDDALVRRQVGDLLQLDSTRWELISRNEIPYALPHQPAPLTLRRLGRLAQLQPHRQHHRGRAARGRRRHARQARDLAAQHRIVPGIPGRAG
ncbi:MAG: FAD-dependent oxidoreductase, partial [Actinomycetales bacterium]